MVWGIQTLKERSFRSYLSKLSWWATIYHIWARRNVRNHGGDLKIEEGIVKGVI
jgi:hypothetical protein